MSLHRTFFCIWVCIQNWFSHYTYIRCNHSKTQNNTIFQKPVVFPQWELCFWWNACKQNRFWGLPHWSIQKPFSLQLLTCSVALYRRFATNYSSSPKMVSQSDFRTFENLCLQIAACYTIDHSQGAPSPPGSQQKTERRKSAIQWTL